MNQRILELAEQATKHYPATESSGEFSTFDKEKFAELIVQDVLKIVKNNTPKPDPYSERARYDAQEYGECVANDIRDDIKYLFGVER